MALIVILVSFTPMLLASGMILDQYYNSYEEKLYDHLNELVHKHTQNIDSFLNERLSDIQFLSDTCALESLSNETELHQILLQLQQSYGGVVEDIGIINEEGVQIAYAGPYKLEKARYSEEAWFNEAIQNQYFISNVFLGLRSRPHFIVSVKKKIGDQTLLLRATINFEAFNSLVENLRIGTTGFAFVINRKGEFQTRPHHDMLQFSPSYSEFVKKGRRMKYGTYVGTLTNVAGMEKVIYFAAPLKDGEWLLVYKQDRKEAYADLKRTRPSPASSSLRAHF